MNSENPLKIHLFRALYNNACGNYSYEDEFFSELFIETFREKYGSKKDYMGRYYRLRDDPRILELYDLLGEQSNLKEIVETNIGQTKYNRETFISQLKVTYFPEELKDYLKINILEGRECLEVDKLKIYKEFYYRVVLRNESVDTLKSHFQRLEYVMHKYNEEVQQRNPTFDDTSIFVKA